MRAWLRRRGIDVPGRIVSGASANRHALSESLLPNQEARESSYVSQLQPQMGDRDRAAFNSRRTFNLFDEDSVGQAPTSKARESLAVWGTVSALYRAKVMSTHAASLSEREEDRPILKFDFKKIWSLFLPDVWFVVAIATISVGSNVMNLFIPSFNANYINSLICELGFSTFYDSYSRNVTDYPQLPQTSPPAPRPVVGDFLAANLPFCNAQQALVLTLAGNCCNPDSTTSSAFYSRAQAGDDFHGFQRSMFFLKAQIYFSVGNIVMKFLATILSFLFQFRFIGRVRRCLIESFLSQEIAFHDFRPAGALTSRVINDVQQIVGLSQLLGVVVNIAVTVCFSAYMAYGYSLPLFVFYLSVIPIQTAIFFFTGRFNRKCVCSLRPLTHACDM